MKKAQGFTLVELLVVIVIIGILATGATSMFTGAQQKARDSVRITDTQAIKLATEQAYGDNAKYPRAKVFASTEADDGEGLEVLSNNGYIDKMPKDPKTGQKTLTSMFYYIYGAKKDAGTHVSGQEFELSVLFENAGNTDTKSVEDGGGDNLRWETGVNTNEESDDGVDTTITEAAVQVDNIYSSSVTEPSIIIDTAF